MKAQRGSGGLRLNDWFCGAGGATQGAHAVPGIVPVLAANHDQLAIDTHSTDCYFRMFEPHEIHAGMAFVPDYVVLGNKQDKVKQLGNAVTPPVAEVLAAALVECIQGHDLDWGEAA